MQFAQAGIILITANYEQCIAFYGETLELPQM